MINLHWLRDRRAERQRILSHRLEPNIAMEVQDINAYYGNKQVVDSFSFSFEKNKVYSFLGKSGSGKSTLAAHFNGLLKSNTANIYLLTGHNIYKFHKKISNFKEIRRTVGMVLQNPEYQLFRETVLEDVCCGLRMLNVPTPLPPEEMGKSKLLELGISEEFFGRSPFMLSGGQKKKIALAGILVIEPEIIVFDEPILGLDPASASQIVEIILDLKNRGKTVIVISNNIDLLLEVGDEMLVLDGGRLLTHGRPYSIFRNPNISLGVPRVVRFIDRLSHENPLFEKLWEYEPRNFEQLAQSIVHVLRK